MDFIKNKMLANKYVFLRALLVLAPIHAYLTFFVCKNSISGGITHFSFLTLFSFYTIFFACFFFEELKGPTFLDCENDAPYMGVLVFILFLFVKGLILFLFLFIDNRIVSFIINFGAVILTLCMFVGDVAITGDTFKLHK